MAGEDDGFTGEARLTPGFTVGFLAQEPQLDPAKDVARQRRGRRRRDEGAGRPLQRGLRGDGRARRRLRRSCSAEQAELQDKIDAAGAWDLDRTFEIAMDALRLPPGDADVDTLSGGERRRVALCRLLLSKPDLLLLDEPTNHLDAESVAWLERTLQDYPGTVVAVTHDRYFLDNVAGWILELDRGAGHPVGGQLLVVARAEAERAWPARRRPTGRASRRSQRELEWIRMSPAGPPGQGQGADQRLRRARRRGRGGRAAGRQARDHDPARARGSGTGRRGARTCARASATGCSSTTSSFLLPPRRHRRRHRPERRRQDDAVPDDRRAGDSRTPATLAVGETVQLAYVDQSRDALDAGHDRLRRDHRRRRPHRGRQARRCTRRAYVRRASASRGATSRRRSASSPAASATGSTSPRCSKSGGNVLLLDEPTNDLDVDTLRALEEALLGFPGCAVVISHDRWFLDRIATHMLAFEGDSEVRWFEGNFSDYEADRKKRLGRDADQPHRIRYKPLVRG